MSTKTKSNFMELAMKKNQSLGSLKFLQASEFKFVEELKKSIQKVNNGSDLDTQVVTLTNFCHGEFENIREEAIKYFSKWFEEQLADQKNKMIKEIAVKEEERRQLQERLDSLLKRHLNNSDSLKILNEQRRDAEEHVRKTCSSLKIGDTLNGILNNQEIMKYQMDNLLKDFYEELNEIKEEIRQNSRNITQNIEDILGQTQYMYKANVKSLVRELKSQYLNDLNHIASQYNDKEERIREAYEAQKKILNKMIDEANALNVKLEKEAELKGLINEVYRSNPDNSFIRNHSLIICNVQEIKGINDLFDRRSRVEDIYNKVRLFSRLYGKNDLGIEAKTSDLEALRLWLEKTNRNAILGRYRGISHPSYDFNDMSREKTNTFNGKDMGKPLLNAKEKLKSKINSLKGSSKGSVQRILDSIFQKNAADDTVKAVLSRPWHWRQHIYQLYYYKNDKQVGEYWKEYQGKYWAYSWGIFGYVAKNCDPDIISPYEAWTGKAKGQFQKDLNETINAINNRAKILFDFETNPDSSLQKLYQESGQTNPSIIDFPSREMEVLIKQCNEFIKMVL